MKVLLIILGCVAVVSCTWVKPTARGDVVRVATADEVADCTKLGETQTSVLATIAGIERSREKIEEEVATLARTSAADMGGDAIVPLGEVVSGERSFAVYRCDKP